jgi:hypothetical protein
VLILKQNYAIRAFSLVSFSSIALKEKLKKIYLSK